jgi:hypothetical protein
MSRAIFLLAFTLRAVFFLAYSATHPDFYQLGGEMGRVALSLIHTGDFADPYKIPTGLTAHPTPLWPSLLALVYGALGVTPAAGYVRAALAIGAHSLLFALMPWFSRRLGLGHRAGVVAGIAGALVPFPMYEIVGSGFSAPSALALGLVVVAFRHRWIHRWTQAPPTPHSSLLLGLACGAAFHVLPPLLFVVAACLGFELVWKRGRRTCALAACVAAGAAVACIPWTWRNHHALHTLCFIRSNFGLELRIANQPGAHADIEVNWARNGTLRHPSENLDEARLVGDLGEAEYMRRARREAVAWIRTHPAEFARLTLLRFANFWCGPFRLPWLALLSTLVTGLALLGLRRVLPTLDPPGRAALLIPLLAFPPVYYLVSYVDHYRAPLVWLLLLLAAFELTHRRLPRPTR